MMQIPDGERRRAFSIWLRTGRLPSIRNAGGVELKFNPWHDAEDGRFTFVGAGNYFRRSGDSGGASADWPGRTPRPKFDRSASPSALDGQFKRAPDSTQIQYDRQVGAHPTITADVTAGKRVLERGSVLSLPAANQARPPARPGPVVGRGSNSRAFEDPITLEQSFPGLRNAPGGSVIAVADNLFDLTGPANVITAGVLQDEAKRLTSEIKALSPTWRYDEIVPTDALGKPIKTVQGLTAKVNDLRLRRAAVVARVKEDYEPLQVETLRFVQQRADFAYDRGVALLKAGRLTPRLSDQEALGNYVDQQVRRNLRDRYNQLGIDSAGAGPVRVNRRESISSPGDLNYRRPDARVKDVAFDVTLTRKTLGTAQVRGFFQADFRPSRVIIIRPRQLGPGHTYAIPRPERKQ